MRAIANVTRRGGVYHFRRAVPEALRRHVRRRELVVSLRTRESCRAKVDAAQLYVASETLFAKIRSTPMLNDDQLARLVQDFYRTILERENLARLNQGHLDDEFRIKRLNYYANVAERARSDLGSNRLDAGRVVTEAMLHKQGMTVAELDRVERAQAQQAVLRAGIDLAEALTAR
ncbi:DUF6538 domain-containing protein [Aquabacter sp. CN5-332]|uniref:DUF6538 domain-containing protein n=1 Tax=Aquabacter sp. CN5-332 TaxID=3156608 RepID=UPI0032B3EE02